jgi:2-polyprenyl-6-methoxyphenol hydroxylase-like FAD-dependent oxidoreductase
MSKNHYDVIIIGGRCAGASLALRLAGNDLKILLVDRATFPSLPNVPSSPFIHPSTMRLMDELGIAESEYTFPGARVEHFVVDFVNYSMLSCQHPV